MKVYEIITNAILKKLEQGSVPWRKPWTGQDQMPKNLITKKEYQGINAFILGCQDYGSPYWLTFKQCKDLGGTVTKGARATAVIYWNWLEIEKDGDAEEKVPLLRYYSVFNTEQCENIPEDKLPRIVTSTNDIDRITICEEIINSMADRPTITHKKQEAVYYALRDIINMPLFASFQTAEGYYSTLFHELVHSTGHEKRLARPGITDLSPFGTPSYSKEELIAEMGAAFLCGFAGIENVTLTNSAAYIQGWLKKLRNDKKLVIVAAAQAQKAVNYILSKAPSPE
ncbi:MAG TPA: zincin-like metallopeptidase domain-containing protein [Syntrophorhabdaceae bacterium]|nr:zincin-like metallopeptidase domain-containing protein [Syntrophorhabdaceae bacterium]